MAATVLFFCLAIAAILGALGMLLSRNPVNSALWLILTLFCIAGLFLTLNAQFIAVVQVVVYAGAIMVLFLFVIMLLNLSGPQSGRDVQWRGIVGYSLAVVVLAQLAYVLAKSSGVLAENMVGESSVATGSAGFLARELFTRYAMPLELVGILLLAATVGAVVIARRKPV